MSRARTWARAVVTVGELLPGIILILGGLLIIFIAVEPSWRI